MTPDYAAAIAALAPRWEASADPAVTVPVAFA